MRYKINRIFILVDGVLNELTSSPSHSFSQCRSLVVSPIIPAACLCIIISVLVTSGFHRAKRRAHAEAKKCCKLGCFACGAQPREGRGLVCYSTRAIRSTNNDSAAALRFHGKSMLADRTIPRYFSQCVSLSHKGNHLQELRSLLSSLPWLP